MSFISEAYALFETPEPPTETDVDVFCPSCVTHGNSRPSGHGHISDRKEYTYIHYVGNDNCHLSLEEGKFVERFTCPKGCKDSMGDPVEMMRFDETGNATPWDEWQAAQIGVQIDKLRGQLEDLEKEYKGSGFNDIWNIVD